MTIPAGTKISVGTIDTIDSAKNHVGDRFQASLEEPLIVDDNVVAAKGVDVCGRLNYRTRYTRQINLFAAPTFHTLSHNGDEIAYL